MRHYCVGFRTVNIYFLHTSLSLRGARGRSQLCTHRHAHVMQCLVLHVLHNDYLHTPPRGARGGSCAPGAGWLARPRPPSQAAASGPIAPLSIAPGVFVINPTLAVMCGWGRGIDFSRFATLLKKSRALFATRCDLLLRAQTRRAGCSDDAAAHRRAPGLARALSTGRKRGSRV